MVKIRLSKGKSRVSRSKARFLCAFPWNICCRKITVAIFYNRPYSFEICEYRGEEIISNPRSNNLPKIQYSSFRNQSKVNRINVNEFLFYISNSLKKVQASIRTQNFWLTYQNSVKGIIICYSAPHNSFETAYFRNPQSKGLPY